MRGIREQAERLCRRGGTRDPFTLSAFLGIGVLFCDLPRQLRGFYLQAAGGQVIMLNQSLDDAAARVTCAHELGHALLHPDSNGAYLRACTLLNGGRYEREADLFSAHLLCGGEDFGAAFDGALTVEGLAARACVPVRLARLYADDVSTA